MNSRERLLAGLIAALIVVMVGYYAWNGMRSAIQMRQSNLDILQAQSDQQQQTIQRSNRAQRELREARKKALPQDAERARSIYQRWVLDLIERSGFAEPTVRAVERQVRTDAYNQLTFEIDAEATFPQIVEFLIGFYSSGDLHRIQKLIITPINNSRRLDLSVAIDVLSLPGADRTTIGDLKSNHFVVQNVDAVRKSILDRNLFFPANVAPKFESIGSQRVPRGQTMRVAARAVDPDSWDQLSYSIVGPVPDGLRLEKKSRDEAELVWTPTENGQLSVQIQVNDDGSPGGSHTQTVEIAVVDPPPVDPNAGVRLGFDDASQTYLVGILANGSQRQAWFDQRTSGRILKLSVGDSLRIGSVQGSVASISDDGVEITTESGSRRIRVGDSLQPSKPDSETPRQAESRQEVSR